VTSHGTLLNEYSDCGLGLYTSLNIGGNNVYICNVHGIAKPGNKLDSVGRLRQSKELIDFFNDKKGMKIIGGDFNLLPDTKSIKTFEENGYRNLVKEFKIDTTRNHYSWDKYPDTKQYYADYVFVPQDTSINTFEVIKNEISDHLPLILELKL
jgi:endonuclease/exonuclease/phosphatase family metal-dependent hydrolase